MSDPIDRQAAIDAIYHHLPSKTMLECRTMLHEVPTADVPDRKVGKWKMNSNYPDMLVCSECDGHFDCWHWEIAEMHYCPNCGARMKGEGDADD